MLETTPHLSASSRMMTLCRPGGRVTFFCANILILLRTTSMPLSKQCACGQISHGCTVLAVPGTINLQSHFLLLHTRMEGWQLQRTRTALQCTCVSSDAFNPCTTFLQLKPNMVPYISTYANLMSSCASAANPVSGHACRQKALVTHCMLVRITHAGMHTQASPVV